MSVLSPSEQPDSPFASMRGDHAGVRVDDLEAALRWYEQTLDFRRMGDMQFQGLTFTFIAPPGNDLFRLELLAGEGAQPRPPAKDLVASLDLLGWHHVCLRVDSVDDTIATLTERGVRIVLPPTDVAEIKRRIAFFADPWDNLFELTQPMAA